MSDGDLQEPGADRDEQPRRQEPQRVGEAKPPRPRWMIAAGIAAAVLVVVVLLVAPVVATSSSSYCGSCHSMERAFTSWQQGQHSSVPCSKCHIPPGTLASVKWRATESRNIWLTYLNMKPSQDSQPRPASENCIECHPLKGLMGVPGEIRMPHARHINQNNLECIDCHDHTAHAAPGGESDKVSMAPCTMCHDQTRDPGSCDFCHSTPPVTDEAHPGDFIAAHGQLAREDERDCLRCHHNKQEFCDGCHQKPTPGHYSGNWPYAHGQQAKKDRARCLGCHTEEQLCNQCHTVDHPADWDTSHAPVAAKGTRSCLVCHPPQMCIDCHATEGVSVEVMPQ